MSRCREEGQGLGREWSELSGLPNLADDFHGFQNIFGLCPSERVSPYRIDYGINIATRLLMRDIRASGSFMSTEIGSSPENMGRNSIFLRQLQPLLRRKVDWRKNQNIEKKNVLTRVGQTLNVAFNEGALKVNKLSASGYGYLKVFQGLMGSNLDIHGYDNLGDIEESIDILTALLRVGYEYCVSNDKPSILSRTNTFGRLTNLHLTSEGDTYSGGINFMCLPKDWKERFTRMLNIRVGQTGDLRWPEKGMRANPDRAVIEEKIAMVGQPETEGEWLMHVARAIRVSVMHGFDSQKIDILTFLQKIPLDKEIAFEAAVGVVDNLVVAHVHNPELTQALIEKFGLGKYFGKANLNEVKSALVFADKELFGGGRGQVESNDFWFFEKREEKEYKKMQDLAELIARYMPVTESEFERLVPAQGRRELVVGEMVGHEAGMWQHNPRALKTYTVDGVEVVCHYVEMEAVLALDKMIEIGKQQGIPDTDLQMMINDRESLWKISPWHGGVI